MEPEKKSNGALIGLIVIVIILVIGGIYVWQSKVKEMEKQNPALTTEDASTLDALDQEAASVNATIDVDINSVK